MNERASKWLERINSADKIYKKWEERYAIKALEAYIEGFQWAETSADYNPYVLNLFEATIETKMPSLLFTNPRYSIVPKPKSLQTNPEGAFEVAANLEDTLNYWVSDEENNFADECQAAILDAWTRFGILEIGYSADWIDNPRAQRPLIRSDYTTDTTSSRNSFITPEKIPVNERVYARHIPAENFRISTVDRKYLNNCDWCGYWEFIRLADLQATPQINNKLKNLGYTSAHSTEFSELQFYDSNTQDISSTGDYIKIWKIWDLRAKKKYIISDPHIEILHEKRFYFFPFVDIRFKKPIKGYYPRPVVFNWLSPQNEVNEVREQHRTHRRRFKRMYTLRKNSADFDEVAKVINGPDGGIVETGIDNAIMPIPNADLGASASIALQTSYSDFSIVSATTPEQRLTADRITATQATLVNEQAGIRESAEKIKVANFMNRVAKKILTVVRNEFVNSYVVPVDYRREEEFGNDIIDRTEVKTIQPLTDLGDNQFDFDVNVAIETMSPVTNQEEMKKFLSFLAILKQYPEMSMSPILVRELASRVGYRNERVIKEFQRMSQLAMIGQVSQGMQNMEGANMAQNTVAQMTPPNNEEVTNQLREQGIPIQ